MTHLKKGVADVDGKEAMERDVEMSQSRTNTSGVKVPQSQGSFTEHEQTEARRVSQPERQQTDSQHEDQWVVLKFFAGIVSLFLGIFGDKRGSNIGHGQTAEIKAALNFSYWVTGLSFAGLISLISVIFGDESGLKHKLLFKACTSLTIATLFSGLALMLLAFINSIQDHLFIVLKIIRCTSLVFLTSAALLASIILLQKFM